MPPSKKFLVQGSGAIVQDMQYSWRVGFTEVTCGIESHFPPPLVERGGESVGASSQNKGQLLGG